MEGGRKEALKTHILAGQSSVDGREAVQLVVESSSILGVEEHLGDLGLVGVLTSTLSHNLLRDEKSAPMSTPVSERAGIGLFRPSHPCLKLSTNVHPRRSFRLFLVLSLAWVPCTSRFSLPRRTPTPNSIAEEG